MGPVQIIIVGYRNPGDIMGCLAALDGALAEPGFEVLICENGGPPAYRALLEALAAPDGPAVAMDPPEAIAGFEALAGFRLRRLGARLLVGLAPGNLGYAGGINAWLVPLMRRHDWPGAWILNPDTEPAPDALAALLAEVARSGRGMVGSHIAISDDPRGVAGLRWRWGMAATLAVPALPGAAAALHAPSGASTYITRALLERIGLPDGGYFLYFEDLEWGYRAFLLGQVGYAHDSVVRHACGTTTGRSGDRAAASRASVRLEFRNRCRFVARHRPSLLAWTALMGAAHALRYLAWGAPGLAGTALLGLLEGLRGRSGPPG